MARKQPKPKRKAIKPAGAKPAVTKRDKFAQYLWPTPKRPEREPER